MKRLFLDIGEIGQWHRPHGINERWQDHGLGMLVTLAERADAHFDVVSLKALHSWAEWHMVAKRYDLVCMNTRSYNWPWVLKASQIAKIANPSLRVWAGGVHATVSLDDMQARGIFDVIWQGEGEQDFTDYLGADLTMPLVHLGSPVEDLDALPYINRTLWPRGLTNEANKAWPLEGPSMGEDRIVTMMTTRGCPWSCAFCAPAERKHFGGVRRRSVSSTLEELKWVDSQWGPFGGVSFHDTLFFQGRRWAEEFLERYPKETLCWPFFGTARVNQIIRWPELFKALVVEANWRSLAIGYESGSDRILDLMDKHCSVEDNMAAIEVVNEIGDLLLANGEKPLVCYAYMMLGVPGEEPEDVFKSLRLARQMRHVIPRFSYFTPYPGSFWGDELLANNRILDLGHDYVGFPTRPKVKGVDYQIYRELLSGRWDHHLGFSAQALMAQQGRRDYE